MQIKIFILVILGMKLLSGCGKRPEQERPIEFPPWATHDQIEQVVEECNIVPPGWRVIIHEPIYYLPSYGGLVRGHCSYANKELHVGWKLHGEELLLPALQHEVDHALYGPEYGH